MNGAALDYERSGFVGVRRCACGKVLYDVARTYDRQQGGQAPYAFVEGSWHGADMFTTDFSPNLFFCTEKVLQCATAHRLTNFRFVPAERGFYVGRGLKY
jgi:hypothetical protein